MAGERLPDTVYGVDFSAAKDHAGRNTWIAECTPTSDDGLVVVSLADAAGILECSPRRVPTLEALVDHIAEDTDERRAYGLDFPFGLPRGLLDGDEDWQSFVGRVRDRDEWGTLGEIDGPRSLYDEAKNRFDGPSYRVTDEECGGQTPTGFRIKTQTYYGINRVIAGVADEVSVVPMDDADGDTLVLETYPKAVFDSLTAVPEGYKHNTRRSIENRRTNVDALDDRGVVFGDHREFAIASDDALDAVAAAYATWKATRSGNPCEVGRTNADADSYALEGYIYC